MAIYSQRLKDLVKEEYQLHSRAAGAYIRRSVSSADVF